MPKTTDKEQKEATKGTRWPLLHRTENASAKHLEVVGRLRPSQPIGRAYLMKEALLDTLRGVHADAGAAHFHC